LVCEHRVRKNDLVESPDHSPVTSAFRRSQPVEAASCGL
jgi:hypothetical protein